MHNIITYLLLTFIVCCQSKSSKGKVYLAPTKAALVTSGFSQKFSSEEFAIHSHKSKLNKKFKVQSKLRKKIKSEENGQKRSLMTSLDKDFPLSKRVELVKEFTEVVKKAFESNIDSSEFEGDNSNLMNVLAAENKLDGNLFKQMDKKMDISESETFKATTKVDEDTINELVSNARPLTKQDWEQLKEMKSNFLPQEQADEIYVKNYFSGLSTYLLTFVAATVDMMHKGKVSPCQLSRELDLLRYDAQTAVQVLIFKRLSMLEPSKNSWSYISGNDKMNWKDKYTNKDICQGKGCVLQSSPGDNPVEKSIEEIGESVLKDAQGMFDVFDSILEKASTDGKFCIKDCECPEVDQAKIQRVNYMKDFPWSCLGEMKDVNKKTQCILPCGKYNESYDWCPVKLKTKNSDWDYCIPPDWKECINGWY